MAEAGWSAEARGRVLPHLARLSLEESFAAAEQRRGWSAVASADWLMQPAASFVTLRAADVLRGCVGSVEAARTLAEDVWENARAAAFRDTRFPPLASRELSRVAIEVSVLSPLEPLGRLSPRDAGRVLRPGLDGVVLQYASHRGLFLPQVWEQLPTADRFLAELVRKAGLPAGFWDASVELWRFRVERWEEEAGGSLPS